MVAFNSLLCTESSLCDCCTTVTVLLLIIIYFGGRKSFSLTDKSLQQDHTGNAESADWIVGKFFRLLWTSKCYKVSDEALQFVCLKQWYQVYKCCGSEVLLWHHRYIWNYYLVIPCKTEIILYGFRGNENSSYFADKKKKHKLNICC